MEKNIFNPLLQVTLSNEQSRLSEDMASETHNTHSKIDVTQYNILNKNGQMLPNMEFKSTTQNFKVV